MYKSLPKPTVLPPDGAQIIRSGDEIHRYALLAQLVERAAVNRVVVGSSPRRFAGVAELADARDLKSLDPYRSYRFDSGPRHYPEKTFGNSAE